MEVVGRAAEAVEIISVYGISSPNSFSIQSSPRPTSLAVPALLAPQPLSCVWLSIRKMDGNYMDPVKLHGLLALNLQHVSTSPGCQLVHVGPSLPSVKHHNLPDSGEHIHTFYKGIMVRCSYFIMILNICCGTDRKYYISLQTSTLKAPPGK